MWTFLIMIFCIYIIAMSRTTNGHMLSHHNRAKSVINNQIGPPNHLLLVLAALILAVYKHFPQSVCSIIRSNISALCLALLIYTTALLHYAVFLYCSATRYSFCHFFSSMPIPSSIHKQSHVSFHLALSVLRLMLSEQCPYLDITIHPSPTPFRKPKTFSTIRCHIRLMSIRRHFVVGSLPSL